MSLLICLFFLTPENLFQGRVVDAATREPIPYVELKILPTGETILTDSAGFFFLKKAGLPERIAISASRVGYETRFYDDVATNQTVTLFLIPIAIPVVGVTSTATRLRLKTEPAMPVAVVEEELGAVKGRQDISKLIAETPGVTVHDYGNLSTISIRGASTEQTLVLLDGVRLNSSLNNQADLTLIPCGIAQRVEVVRGGASALYGAAPIGGVVNIITPDATCQTINATAGLGSFGRRYARFNISLPGTIDWLLGTGFLQADNRFPFKDSLDSLHFRNNANLTRADFLFKSGLKLGRQYLSFLGTWSRAARGSPGPLSFPSDSARLNDERLVFICGYDRQQSDNARLSARFFHQRLFENYYNPDEYFYANDTQRTIRTGLNVNERMGDFVFGFESDYEKAKSTTVAKPERNTIAFYLEAGFNYQGFSLNPMLRYELMRNKNNDSAGYHRTYGAFSPKLSLTFSRFKPFTFYLGANRSFRNPTFNEMWWPEDAWTKGNPKLAPEWASGLDAGAGWNLGSFGWLRAGFFCSRVTDLIQWQMDENFVYQPVNIARAQVTGAELEENLNFGWFGINGNGTYQVCRTDTSDLPYRPRIAGRVSIWLACLKGSVQPVRITLSAKGVAKRFVNVENTETLPGYLLFALDATLNLRLKSLLPQIRFGCDNLLDHKYQAIKDYPVPGRSFYLETAIGM